MHDPPAPQNFNLLRWFSAVSILVVASVGAVSAWAVSRYFVVSTLQRDADLSGQFIQLIAEAEIRHAQLTGQVTMGELLDMRGDEAKRDIAPATLAWVRGEFFDHVTHLPDALLVNIFAPDHVIVLSSNPDLVGRRAQDSEGLERAFQTGKMTGTVHTKPEPWRSEQQFVFDPDNLYVENYIPLTDANSKVVSIVEIYKEPEELLRTLTRGYLLIWAVGLASAAVVWGALFWIVRHGARQLRAQHEQLVENETLVAIGELSSAVAHGLRNPLASIRSSAELAMEADVAPIRKNLDDIVTQVDRMSKWVRELLLYARPLADDYEAVDLYPSITEALRAVETQMKRSDIELDWSPKTPSPRILGHDALLVQALNSVLSNAVEAMPRGGRLTISVEPARDGKHVALAVSDTGVGMSEEQLAKALKLYYSTKRTGLGVGLPLVKRIMERFGGSLEIESREKSGTSVRLLFVLA